MLDLRRGIGTHQPSVISLGQVWVDIMMNVDEIPPQGGFAVADHPKPSIGGSYRVLEAVSRMGVQAEHAGILGNGLWANFIRQSFQDNGINHIGQDRLDEDSGFRVVLSSGDPKKTFIASYGAEAHGGADTFEMLEPQNHDVVHISGNTLMDHTAAGVDGFLLQAGTDPATRDYALVINPTNTLRLVNDHMLEDLVLARPIWSCNRQEAMTLAERLGAPIDDSKVTIGGGLDDFMHQLCDGLGHTLRAPLVVRVGSLGAWVREPGGETIHVPGFPTKAVHTRSAGGCHTGVMCAMLAEGRDLTDAVKLANAATSIAISRSRNGIPQCPDYDEALALLKS
ncbi:PfkB family carbohydrate kinase [Bifidobacterium felsineum]|uniref:Sugar kinase n=1 Tax=Bifidobacterium felsineum TaxID=2045440 RepID=A0A2M9HLV2_9BIFI|nr:PfkB family carbohydrate kinase [Bifidobacterium felsineum]MBT1163970.1 sugar kinase [Bifidobacterium felsineum]PJM77798.1 sugar kinase [Bifidobacterium felsineum]